MSFDPEAVARVRRLLPGRDDVVKRKMVGGLSFLVNGNMCCGITGMALMIRVGAESRTYGRCSSPAGSCLASYASNRQAIRLTMRSPAGYNGDSTSPPGSRRSPSARVADRSGRIRVSYPRQKRIVAPSAAMHKYAAWLASCQAVTWAAMQPARRRALDNRALTRRSAWHFRSAAWPSMPSRSGCYGILGPFGLSSWPRRWLSPAWQLRAWLRVRSRRCGAPRLRVRSGSSAAVSLGCSVHVPRWSARRALAGRQWPGW